MSALEKAIRIALTAHAGQAGKDGSPSVGHAPRVMEHLVDPGQPTHELIV